MHSDPLGSDGWSLGMTRCFCAECVDLESLQKVNEIHIHAHESLKCTNMLYYIHSSSFSFMTLHHRCYREWG